LALALKIRVVPVLGSGLGFFFGTLASSDSTRSPPAGRSRMWPKEDFTINPLPRYLLMVLALAGDSTMTSERVMSSVRITSRNPERGRSISFVRRIPCGVLSTTL
jgi:hypothetical protein